MLTEFNYSIVSYYDSSVGNYSPNDLSQGVYLERGLYYIMIKNIDNLVQRSTFEFEFVEHYTITLQYSVTFPSTVTYDVDDLKIDNVGGVIWTNKYVMDDTPVKTYEQGFLDDFSDSLDREFLYKRIYILDDTLLNFLVGSLSELLNLIDGTYDDYLTNVEAIEGGITNIISGLSFGNSLASLAATALSVSYPSAIGQTLFLTKVVDKIVDEMRLNFQTYLLLTNLSEILQKDSYGNLVKDSDNQYVVDPELYSQYVGYLDVITETISSLLSVYGTEQMRFVIALLTSELKSYQRSTFYEDDYLYIDVMGKYILNGNDIIEPIFYFKNWDENTVPDLEHFISSNSFYTNYYSGKIYQNQLAFKNIKNEGVLSIKSNNLINYGDYSRMEYGTFATTTYIDNDYSQFYKTEITLPYPTTYYTTFEGSPIYSSTLLNNVYAYNTENGYMQVNVDTSLVNYNIPGLYRITYYVVRPDSPTTKVTKTFYVRVYELPDDGPILEFM